MLRRVSAASLPGFEALGHVDQVPSPVFDKFRIERPGHENGGRAQQDRVFKLRWPCKQNGRGIRAELKEVLEGRFGGRK